jgi:acyl-CoA synthetase (AMP-forming)/AMP-acid ligase II
VNVASLLEAQARHCGARDAVVEGRRRITFAELDRASRAAGGELLRAGVRPGARAVLIAPMSIALYTTLIAMFRLRVTAVFVDPSAGREALDRAIERIRPDAFVASPKAHLLRLVSSAIRAIPVKTQLPMRLTARGPDIESCDPDTPAIITFTSGSTGGPKAIVRTHGFLIAQHRALAENLELQVGLVDFCALPIFVLANLASGVTSVIPDADLRHPGDVDARRIAAQIGRERPDRMAASPALLARLADHVGRSTQPLESVRRIYTGGAPVFPPLLDAIAAAAPQASVIAVYGSTEAEPIATIDRREVTDADRQAMATGAGLLAGHPAHGIDVRVMSASARAGEPGEIVVAGGHVVEGYLDGYGDEESKIRVDRRVWHRTGDAGYFDASGRLWLLGRCAARVSDAHGVLYPFAVECAASRVSGVVRTAVATRQGRRVLAAQVSGDAARVRTELLGRLAWARLDEVIVVRRIPVDRRHNAKVDYRALAKLLTKRDVLSPATVSQ